MNDMISTTWVGALDRVSEISGNFTMPGDWLPCPC